MIFRRVAAEQCVSTPVFRSSVITIPNYGPLNGVITGSSSLRAPKLECGILANDQAMCGRDDAEDHIEMNSTIACEQICM